MKFYTCTVLFLIIHTFIKFLYSLIVCSHPAGYSGVAEVRSVISLGGRAPAEPGEDDDEGDEVEEGGHGRVDHLHLEEGEGQLDLDVVPDPQQVEEGPEDRDDEAGHHHEEEPVIVTHAEGKFCSVEGDVDGGGGAGHTHHAQDLKERGFVDFLSCCIDTRQNENHLLTRFLKRLAYLTDSFAEIGITQCQSWEQSKRPTSKAHKVRVDFNLRRV